LKLLSGANAIELHALNWETAFAIGAGLALRFKKHRFARLYLRRILLSVRSAVVTAADSVLNTIDYGTRKGLERHVSPTTVAAFTVGRELDLNLICASRQERLRQRTRTRVARLAIV
jgi:hypothetical protein